jgi:2,5-furandicarboxylate decarboxylase 1
MAASLDCDHRDIGKTFLRRLQAPRRPVMVPTGPVKEVIRTGKDVDLTALPVPLVSRLDGGPYITSAVGIAKDPEFGRNVGMYRLMIRTGRETSIDLVSASDLKLFYERAFKAGRPLPFAAAIGVHPVDGARAFGAGRTGRIRTCRRLAAEPVQLVKCETVDLRVPASAERVEANCCPWLTEDEGRFGDFTGFVGPVKGTRLPGESHHSPQGRDLLRASHARGRLHSLAAAGGRRLAGTANAGITAKAVYAPQSAGCNFHLYASVKRPGENKNAVLALLAEARQCNRDRRRRGHSARRRWAPSPTEYSPRAT